MRLRVDSFMLGVCALAISQPPTVLGVLHSQAHPTTGACALCTLPLTGGKPATGWKLEEGKGQTPVPPFCSTRKPPTPARVQHVDQLLCQKAHKNRHWFSCAIEPRHPPVGA